MRKRGENQAQPRAAARPDHHLIGALATIALLAVAILVAASIKLHGG